MSPGCELVEDLLPLVEILTNTTRGFWNVIIMYILSGYRVTVGLV